MHEHEHVHGHEHSHEHLHEDGTVHSHSHSHEHSHPHSHGEISGFESTEQATALMGYMLDHNRHHAEELHDLCHKLEADGRTEAAGKIHQAVDCFQQGNDLLAAALEQLKG